MCRQGDGDAADAEAGNERGDIDPEILEDEEKREGPNSHANDELNDRDGVAHAGLRPPWRKAPGKAGRDDAICPESDLDKERDDEDGEDELLDRPRQLQYQRAGIKRRNRDEEAPRFFYELPQNRAPAQVFGGTRRGKAMKEEELRGQGDE